MVTVAHLTKKILQEKPFVHEALVKDLINIGALAEMIQPQIEKEMGKVKTSAISMAIRRYLEKSKKEFYQRVRLSAKSDLLVKSNLFEISAFKSQRIFKKLMKLYDIVSFSEGDTLNIIEGNYEVLIIGNVKYRKRFLKILKGEKVKKVQDKISSLSMKIPKKCVNRPGFFFAITRALALENVNIIDLVNTETEITLILDDKHVTRAYDILKNDMSVEYYEK